MHEDRRVLSFVSAEPPMLISPCFQELPSFFDITQYNTILYFNVEIRLAV